MNYRCRYRPFTVGSSQQRLYYLSVWILFCLVSSSTAKSWVSRSIDSVRKICTTFQERQGMINESSCAVNKTLTKNADPLTKSFVAQTSNKFNTTASTLAVKERRLVQISNVDSTDLNDAVFENETSKSLWLDSAVTRIVKLVTYFAIGQSFINLLKANRSEITKELANKLFSEESIEVIKTIQSILSNFHTEHGVVDVFGKYRTMDVLAAIVALSRLQTTVIPYERSILLENSSKRQLKREENVQLFNELAHYAKFAHAAYGWSLDLALRWRIHVGGNNQALVRLTGIDVKDIVKAEWTAKLPHRPAYFIARDRRFQSIVLCIRGTWSAHDMLTNLCCTTSQVFYGNDVIETSSTFNPLQFFNRRLSAHQGMIEAARAIKDDTEKIINNELKENPTYSLVLVGHSLGGGCAAILGKLWENRYPAAPKVYLYGAPCVSRENAILARNIVSVVAKGDPFSCLSLGHIADISTGLAYLCENDELRNEILIRTTYRLSQDEDVDDNLLWCQATMTLLQNKMKAVKLYPPGRILLLRNGKQQSSVSKKWRWMHLHNKPILQDVTPQYFQDLVINAKMFDLSKHLPSMYVSTLEYLN